MTNSPAITILHRQRESLQRELAQNRRASLFATQNGDFRKVGQLTLQAAQINAALIASAAQEDSLL